jgi:uncharacterized SAM-binding protein YcdF (DUF218 family)
MNPEHHIYHFLNKKDAQQKADVIIGFGHFDRNIPKRCCDLYLQGMGRKIIYSGGVGAGSADFKNAEAIEFLNYTKVHFPQIPADEIIIEDRSTNTGENIRFSMTKMRELSPGFNFESGIRSAILVATPARQLRVYLTVKMYLENIRLINLPPETTLEENIALFDQKNESFAKQLTGELDRLMIYPAQGLCEKIEIPGSVLKAYQQIKSDNKNLNIYNQANTEP